jgi:hypothetical protein
MGLDLYMQPMFGKTHDALAPVLKDIWKRCEALPPGPEHDALHAQGCAVFDVIYENPETHYRDPVGGLARVVGGIGGGWNRWGDGGVASADEIRAVIRDVEAHPVPAMEDYEDYAWNVSKREHLLRFMRAALEPGVRLEVSI